MPAANASRKTNGSGLQMSLLTASFVFWLFIGATVYGHQSCVPVEGLRDFTLLLILSLVMEHFALLGLTALKAKRRMGDRAYNYISAAIMGFGISTFYSAVSTGWRCDLHRIFWGLSGIYIGLLLETATGVYDSCARWMDTSTLSGAENEM
ncbi:hypothetical protein K456DRAFT_1726632 [Colletotrichum gloeosporioides 23]|nr:hypothetical protein K456DRAFT_1726632 [Colletotrichum gloeosporioides 23]